MILSYSGDPFLARRAARGALAEQGVAPSEVVVLAEDLEPESIVRAAAQGGLFGRVAVFCDFDEAFQGQAGVKPRNDAIAALADVDADALVVVVDSAATPARQKRYRALGRHSHLAAPRFGRLPRWTASELDAAGVRYRRGVPEALAELFGEDPAAIASEVRKLATLEETLDAERVRTLANRSAATDAFELLERIVDGDAAASLDIVRTLLERGEPAQRVFGALAWQFRLVARAVARRQRDGERNAPAAGGGRAAERTDRMAARLDEAGLRRALRLLLDGDTRAKSGGDAAWALERSVLVLAGAFERGR